jgi:long-chain acyl-CoA synthetase
MQGEYIAPEKLEAVFTRSPLVAQAFVYGDSLKAQLVAVVVPDPDALLPWAAERGMPQDLAALCGDASVRAAVLRSMQQEGQAGLLKGFEQVHAVHLLSEPFSVENGMLTPSFKLKRPQIKEAFQRELDNMYRALDGMVV